VGLPGWVAAAEKPDAAGLDFFEKKIRPVLAEKCYKCHSADAEKIKGGLVLDTREGSRQGGDSGPAVVPGNLKDSLLIEAIRYENKDFAMPPKKSGGKLPEEVIKDFEKWIGMGAPDPRDGKPAKALTQQKQNDYGEARNWWAWQTPHDTKAPAPKDAAWAKTEIDQFLLAGMEAKGVKPVGDADKMTLLRRVYFDLVGLPPPPAEIRAFYADSSPAAFEKLVDRLLASPQFGERWGRHWLDVARYAESSGKDANIAYPHAWRYRDYVIGAFNADKPYDQFIREQIAGDLLPAKNDQQRAEQIVATGFLALGPKGQNERNPRQFALDVADEQIDATSQAFLGLTVACARCHDHKFDPIPQKEYYSLAGIFLSTETKYGTARGVQNLHSSELIELPAGAGAPKLNKSMSASDRQRKEARLAQLQKDQAEIFQSRMQSRGEAPAGQQQLRALRVVTELGLLEKDLANYDESGQMKALAMGVQDLPATRAPMGGGFFGRRFNPAGRPPGAPGGPGGPGAYPPGQPGNPQQMAQMAQAFRQRGARPPEFQVIGDSAVYTRGDADKPGEKTPRGFLTLLTTTTPPQIQPGGSGRRELADWIASPANPLTARVMVNRVWHWVFGQGIVTSPDNFGTTGNKPGNQALLDTLAVRFAENGWSVKKLVREIVLSHAYQLASTHDAANFAADPENTLGWRMSKRRLEAECIRDAILATSGQLNPTAYPGSVIAYSGDGPVGFGRNFGVSEESIVDSGSRSNLRSVYLPVARDVLPDALAVFDFSEPSLVSGSRDSTNVPSQALYLLNSPFVATASQKFASRVLAAHPAGPNGGLAANLYQRVTTAYWMAYSRGPTPAERQAANDFFTKFPASWKHGEEKPAAPHDAEGINAAWTSFCRALFASAEFRYLN
jgi:hypothetical protein